MGAEKKGGSNREFGVKKIRRNKMKSTITALFSAMFLFLAVSLTAGDEHAGHTKTEMMNHGTMAENCVMSLDADYTIKETKDGVIITIKAKKGGADVKTIRDRAKKCMEMGAAGKNKESAAKADEDVVCPVMGTKMKKSKAYETVEYEGKTYYMCCAGCKEIFLKDPKKYIKSKK